METNTQRRSLIDMAQGGSGKVPPYVEALDPPQTRNGRTYTYVVVDNDGAGGLHYSYVENLDQANKLLSIGDLDI